MSHTLTQANFNFPNQTNYYKGKVRDVYTIGKDVLVMVASDRISAFDVVLPRGIAYKGQILNQIAAHFLQATTDIVPNWTITSPDPQVTIGKRCEPFKVEMVVRGYLSGHAARIYNAGGRQICGVTMPNGLKENDKFPTPIITPTTKASVGHDEDISREEIIAQNIVSEADYNELERITLALYERGTQMAAAQNLLLVDTKYEFGKIGNTIYLMDEIHTPDSSRYFYKEGYEARQANNEEQKQLSKEFVRQWLIANNFMGKEGQVVPVMTNEYVQSVSERYIELYEQIVGQKFIKHPTDQLAQRIETNVIQALANLAK
jgi:phosphoribosylaminoimidazole-succinocarboxamide synthase